MKTDSKHPDIYLIHPVASITEEQRKFLDNYVREAESTGRLVHYPIRDVDQADPIGLRICAEHRYAMWRVSEAHIYFDKTSNGSMFDLGMVFMANKPLRIINPQDVEGVSNCVTDFIFNYTNDKEEKSENYIKMLERREEIKRLDEIIYDWEKTPEKCFDFGMAFMADKPILVKRIAPHKCFENVLLQLDQMYRR